MKFSISATVVLLLFSCSLLMGCASFDIETPPQMVVIEKSSDTYVAMTHDGVVLRANVYSQGDSSRDVPRGSQEFWVKSTRERMRTTGGYALLDETAARSADGHEGTRLEFGRDQNGVPYHYWVILFVTDDHIHVIDVGGRQDRFEDAKEAVQQALASYEVN